jgi:imidazolonepropionase-like amidohydrolase
MAALLAATAAGCGGYPKPTQSAFALTGCRLIDGTGRSAVDDAVVLVEAGKITGAGPRGETPVPAGTRTVDLRGATVLPGFINSHVHKAYDEKTLHAWLSAGVTTVRDEAPFISGDFIKERNRLNGNLQNASIVAATPILTVPGGYGTASFTSAVEAGDAVRQYAGRGADIIKFSIEDDLQGRTWTMPTAEECKAIADAAHEAGRKVSVHICHTRNLPAAVAAGVDDIAHMTVEPVDDAVLQEIVKAGIYWEPTLELWQGVSRIYGSAWLDVPLENLTRFYIAGGSVALGTDYAGYTCSFDTGFPITEVRLMSRAGMSAMDIIVAGTRNAAHVCGLEGVKGTVEAGRAADLLVVGGDPLADLEALLDVKMVVHGGEIVVNNLK